MNFFKYRIGNPNICDYKPEDLTAYLPTDIVCPDNCTSEYHGTCDCATGLCMCKDGYSGDNCAQGEPKPSCEDLDNHCHKAFDGLGECVAGGFHLQLLNFPFVYQYQFDSRMTILVDFEILLNYLITLATFQSVFICYFKR